MRRTRFGRGWRNALKPRGFFDSASGSSLAKSRIVFDYFRAWAKIILPRSSGKIVYMDLYCGPGVYADGTESTPLLILRHAISDEQLRRALVTVFNDEDVEACKALDSAIKCLPGARNLANAPQICASTIDEGMARILAGISLAPTLLFVDPWGYKGLSLDLVNAVLKDWACECLFFFNYNRVNAALTNPKVTNHVDALFGRSRADTLRRCVGAMTPAEREALVVRTLVDAVVEEHSGHALAFKFPSDQVDRTSHFLVFVTKHRLGYNIMKDIMAKAGALTPDGVPTYEYIQPDKPYQFGLFDGQTIPELAAELAQTFAGRTMTVKAVVDEHHYGRPFIRRNYKAALIQMEAAGLVLASRPAAERRAGTLADDIEISFIRPGAE